MAKEEETRPDEEKHSRDKKASEAHEAESEPEDEDEDDGHNDDDADDGDEPVEAEVAKAKGADPAPAKPATKEEKAPARATSGRARPRPVRAPPPPPPPAVNLGARVIVFVVVLGALMAGFWALSGFDSGLDKPVISWRIGQMIDMDITLVKEDATNLACSSSQVIAGKRCEYTNKTDKAPDLTDATTLKPYTTADGVNFVAAGVWSQPALTKAKLPDARFTIHCKFKVEGSLKTPLIRWNPTAAWGEKKEDWFGGSVSDCKMNPP